jgi:fructose-1,6-bisphosphatase I/sedoheptulose-1,7-bisphosphatase/fructose-1,6-bisphosphatase I
MIGQTTFAQFVIEAQRAAPQATGDLSALLIDVVTAVKAIAAEAGKGAGVDPGRLDGLARELLVRSCAWGGHVAGFAAEGDAVPTPVPDPHPRGKYLLAFDAIDGARNLDVNGAVGTVFSILRRPDGAGDAAAADFLQPGARQVAAGYAFYGPATMVVVTLGQGVQGFTLDRELGHFVLTHRDLAIPPGTRELAIDPSGERFWEPPVKRYVEECRAGRAGPRGADFRIRGITSLVAKVHRILVRGGVLVQTRHAGEASCPGRLYLHEAAPMAYLVEQAGGAAIAGGGRLLDLAPEGLGHRVPVVLGAREEVERIARYHEEHARGADLPYRSPLFGSRSLYTQR